MRNLRIIAVTGLVIFGLFVAATNGIAAYSRSNQEASSIDSVSRWEKRVQSTLEYIPSDVSVIGYVADWDIPGLKYNLIDQDNEYTLTQYALAPRRLQPGLDHEWLIGNFTSPGFQDWLDENLSSYELTEIGFGIYVIHNTSS